MIDYVKVFNAIPGNYALLDIDAPKFTILAVNDAYCESTEVNREDVLGKGLFESYPEDPNGKGSSNIEKVMHSILRCIETKESHNTGIVRYDIPVNCTREYDVKYWSPKHVPVLNDNGEVQYVLEAALDITKIVNMGLEIPNT